MTYFIAYGTDTESLEDPDQLVLVGCPDDWAELDSDDLAASISHEWQALESRGGIQALVGEKDVLDMLRTIIPNAPGLDGLGEESVQRVVDYILGSLNEAFTGNYNTL